MMRRLALALVVVFLGSACLAKEVKVAKGDYEMVVTENGFEAKYKGIPILCATHLNIQKPEWKGMIYSARTQANRMAKVEAAADSITITDDAPGIEGQITQKVALRETGLEISLTLKIGKDIPPSPTEYAIVFPADVFAGGQYLAVSLLGSADAEPIPVEKPTAKGPGTQLLHQGLFGLELVGKGVALSVECDQGPAPSLYDMRSREYPEVEKNFWLLYSWPSAKGEMSVRSRISAQAVAPPTQQARQGKVIILDGNKPFEARCIAVDKETDPVEKGAAADLQRYISKMCGRELPVVECDEKKPHDQGVIYVGRGRAAEKGGFFKPKFLNKQELERLGYDGFVVRSKKGNVIVAGKNARGTAHAVYCLLEKLGCRFYAREMEVVPTAPTIEVDGPFEVKDSAAFEWRVMTGNIAPVKCRLSPGDSKAQVGDAVFPRMMGIPKNGWFWHHTMGFLMQDVEGVQSHPEYLALIGGQRKRVEQAVQQFCLSNPDVLRLMTEKVLKWVAEDPAPLYYPVHYGDVVAFCECDQCKALYAEKGSVTDAVIWFDNQIAKEVAKKAPGKFVTILAYHSTRRAPVKVRPEPNLLIIFCAIVECQGRPWSAPINMKKNVCKDLEDWVAVHPLGAKGIISFDYPTTYRYAGFPYPALYAYVENIRYYNRLGLRGAYVCGIGSWKHLEHLYSYVMPRILWRPGQDLGALIDEFTQAWYGKAARPMREYVEMLHRGAMESQCDGVMDCHAGPGQKFFKELYTREFLDKALALFDEAERLADNDVVKRRIWMEKWGVLFVDLFLHGAKGGDLVPVSTDVGIQCEVAPLSDYRKMAELLRIHRLFNRPWEVEPRRQFTLSSITGITPEREPWWASPRVKEIMENPDAAHEKQSSAREEMERDLVMLENPQWKVTIIPRLGGRIWRLYHKGAKQDILWRGAIPRDLLSRGADATRYVNLGGYEEYTGEKFGSTGWAEAYERKPSADDKSVMLVAALPGGLRLTRKVALVDDGIEIESALENVSEKTVPGVMLRAHPEFVLKPGENVAEIRVKGADGKWATVPFKSESALSGKQLPSGAWGVALPKARVTITNEFDPAQARLPSVGQVGACFPYLGKEFFNLELFSPKKDLAPGDSLRLRHRYLVVHN